MPTNRNSAREDSSLHQQGMPVAELKRRMNEALEAYKELKKAGDASEFHLDAQYYQFARYRAQYEAARDGHTDKLTDSRP